MNFDHTPLSIESVTLRCHFDNALGPTLSRVLRGNEEDLSSSSNMKTEFGSENWRERERERARWWEGRWREREREREREKERWREVGIKGEGSQIKMIQNALTFCSFIVSMSNIWHANWTLAISLILWMCSISSWRLLDHAPPSRDEEEVLQSWKWGLDPSGAVG